eukprot:4523334-Prymnesium_polylepis.1
MTKQEDRPYLSMRVRYATSGSMSAMTSLYMAAVTGEQQGQGLPDTRQGCGSHTVSPKTLLLQRLTSVVVTHHVGLHGAEL